MEKVVYIIRSSNTDGAHQRLHEAASELNSGGATHIQINIADDDVAAAEPLRIANSPHPPTAMISLWIDTAIDSFRSPIDAIVASAASGTAAGYLVTESVPLVNTTHAPSAGDRTFGFSQIACLPRPDRIAAEQWRSIWQDDHTAVAIETQSTFGYVQNLVTRMLTPDAPAYSAIVEELFPPAAMDSPHAFFDATGDDDRLQQHISTMVESTSRFLDYDRIDVFPTSQYVLAPAT